jgi:Uma2 family endonuclease
MSTIETNNERITYSIQFPRSYPLKDRLEDLQKYNEHILLELGHDNYLHISESEFFLKEFGSFSIKLPAFTADMFHELHNLNDEIKLEFDDKEEVFVSMGTIAFISLLTMLIGASLVHWARNRKVGNVYGENGEYTLDDPQNPGKKIRRIPDISYISYSSVSEEEQDSWDGFIPKPPNLVIEIVSAKEGLNKDLKKMQDVWMKSGADVGLVICPYSETIYIFEKEQKGYKTQSIYSDFYHSLLPGYSDNFGKYIKKGRK